MPSRSKSEALNLRLAPDSRPMNLALMFRVMGIALFIQLALGGLVTFNYLDPLAHIVWGVVLGILALATLVYVVRMPSKPKQLVGLTIGIGADIVVQAVLGFAAIGTSSDAIAWLHFVNALAIYAMTFSGSFMAMRASTLATGASPSQPR